MEDAAAGHPDWSGLPGELIALVMQVVDIPGLFSAGAVCTSWRAAFFEVRRARIPITDASPCLLYSCASDDPDTATIYSTSNGAVFKVRLPGPEFRGCYTLGSAHGWVFLADEESNLHLVNPVTGATVDLPPVTGLHNIESFTDDQGHLMYNRYGEWPDPERPCDFNPQELRLYTYTRAYLTCSPSAGTECIALLVHQPDGQLSFARLGDDHWTSIAKTVQPYYRFQCATYNNKDGLFYLLCCECSVYTLDLNGASPVLKMIFEEHQQWDTSVRSVVFAPWGDLLQVWRLILDDADETDGRIPEELEREDADLYREIYTEEIELCKVDIAGHKLIKVASSELRGHSLFLGFNSTMLLSTEKFPALKKNRAYMTENSREHICVDKYDRLEVGIWNFETKAVESLGDVQRDNPWLNWPLPIWFTPSLS